MNLSKAEIIRSIQRRQRNAVWIDKSMRRLRKQFGDQYIAVKNRRVIDSDDDFEPLLGRLRKLGDTDSVTIEYVTKEEVVWIL